MRLDPDLCYQTLLAKDRRFDGWFFVGVSSTGIYCRPVCPVRTPKRENCRFFANAAAAERAGFRPCLRCRPELAPGNGLLDVSSRLASAAAALIDDGFLDTGNLADLAARVGVTDRHLRRIFDAEFGVSLLAFAQTRRLLTARQLLTDTRLPIGTVALAAGFGSVRRFNDLFLKQYGLNPQRFRNGADVPDAESMTFALGYRPPFRWPEMLAFLAHRCIDGVERIDGDTYSRTLAATHGGREIAGWIGVRHAPQRYALDVTLSISLAPAVGPVLARVRRFFDLAARPDLIDAHLGNLAADAPGLRVPGALDGFEIAVRAIVGQRLPRPDARAALARIAARFGTRTVAPAGLDRLFPSAAILARTPVCALEQTGVAPGDAQALVAVANEVSSVRVTLDPAAPLDETLAALRGIRGVGEWAVQYIAMRALGWPNAFPDDATAAQPDRRAPAWQPWRAYAAVHLWNRSEQHARP